jgi:hypothetical protein
MKFVKTMLIEAKGHPLIRDGYVIEWRHGWKMPENFVRWKYVA